jgi:hypothetical protein
MDRRQGVSIDTDLKGLLIDKGSSFKRKAVSPNYVSHFSKLVGAYKLQPKRLPYKQMNKNKISKKTPKIFQINMNQNFQSKSEISDYAKDDEKALT